MAEVQSQPISRPSKQKVSLDGFLACGGKIEHHHNNNKHINTKEDPRQEQEATTDTSHMIKGVCEDVNLGALLSAAKNDKLPTTPVKRSKPRMYKSKSKNKKDDFLGNSGHVKGATKPSEGPRRASDGARKGISRSQSFDGGEGLPQQKRNIDMKKSHSSDTMKRTNSKLDRRKNGVSRSKSFDVSGEGGCSNIPVKRIPRNVPRGEGLPVKPTREKPTRTKSLGGGTTASRQSRTKLGEKQGSRRKLTGETKEKDKSKEKDKKPKEERRRSRSRKQESKRPPGVAVLGEAPEPQPNERAQSLPTFPVQFPPTEDALGDAAFEATFGGPDNDSVEKEKLPASAVDDDDDSDSESECDNDKNEGIMQFDPTAMDNVVVVRQDSGAFPSCPVEMDISLPNHHDDNLDVNKEKQSPASPEPGDEAKGRWGMGNFFKRSNSFGRQKTLNDNNNEDTDNAEPGTSLFNSLFSHSQHGVQHQQLGDDDDSYIGGGFS